MEGHVLIRNIIIPLTLKRFRGVFKLIWYLVFTNDVEIKLATYLHEMESGVFGLIVKDVLDLAFQWLNQTDLNTNFAKQKEGYELLRGFSKCNPDITVRAPEPTSAFLART